MPPTVSDWFQGPQKADVLNINRYRHVHTLSHLDSQLFQLLSTTALDLVLLFSPQNQARNGSQPPHALHGRPRRSRRRRHGRHVQHERKDILFLLPSHIRHSILCSASLKRAILDALHLGHEKSLHRLPPVAYPLHHLACLVSHRNCSHRHGI